MSSFFNHYTDGEASPDWLFLVAQVLSHITESGTTTERPTQQLYAGRQYFDTTLGFSIRWNGTVWVNSAGAPV